MSRVCACFFSFFLRFKALGKKVRSPLPLDVVPSGRASTGVFVLVKSISALFVFFDKFDP